MDNRKGKESKYQLELEVSTRASYVDLDFEKYEAHILVFKEQTSQNIIKKHARCHI